MLTPSRTRALVVGAGKIGTAIASLLPSAPDYDLRFAVGENDEGVAS